MAFLVRKILGLGSLSFGHGNEGHALVGGTGDFDALWFGKRVVSVFPDLKLFIFSECVWTKCSFSVNLQ